MTSFPMQNYSSNSTAYNPRIFTNSQFSHLDEAKKPKGIKTVTALVDYESKQTDHLAFKAGDIILLLEKYDDG